MIDRKFFKGKYWFLPLALIGIVFIGLIGIILISFMSGYYKVQTDYRPAYQEPEIEEGVKTWIKEFVKPGYDVAKSIQQTPDGEYIAVGTLDNEANMNTSVDYLPVSDVYLLKFDSDGNKIWEKIFGGEKAGGAESIQQTIDGGYVIAGGAWDYFGLNTKFDSYIIKTDKDGNKVWEKTFDLFGMNENDIGFSVQQTTDGGYMLGGMTSAYISSKYRDAFLLKTDAYGNKLWEKKYGGDEDEDTRSAQQTSDGGYIIAGTTMSFNSTRPEDENIYIVKTDENGNKLWERAIDAFDKHEQDEADDIQQTSDGGYIIAGGMSSISRGVYAYLLKIDANGNKVWEKTYGNYAGKLVSVQQTSDGGYVATGSIGARQGTGVYLLKTDVNGNKIWEKVFRQNETVQQTPDGRILAISPLGHSVQQTSDGGYVIAGEIDYGFVDLAAPWQDQSNILLIKTDGKGDVYNFSNSFVIESN